MTIDVILALVTTIGLAGALSLAAFAAGALAERGKGQMARLAVPANHPDQPSDTRELVLR